MLSRMPVGVDRAAVGRGLEPTLAVTIEDVLALLRWLLELAAAIWPAEASWTGADDVVGWTRARAVPG